MSFFTELKHAARSLLRAKGLAATVILTLALGIGANSAIFTLVRGVLLRPLPNRDEDRLIFIRQSAPGVGLENARFSVPEIQDLRGRVKSVSEFGDFSTIGFAMVGLGEPREVRAGVVSGSYFDVMGLHPVLGRLLDMRDDGPSAAGAVVLTHRFWTTALKSDASVVGKTVRLGDRAATIVGVLEPSVPYPAETEIIANVVTSPHHLSATMVTGRVHRMTDLFGRLAPGSTLEQARAELRTVHSAMMKEHPEAYSAKADVRIDAVRLREQVTARARPVLLVLLAASVLIFVIACANVANLMLARTVRRENELAIRAALGAGSRALRRTLLAESLLLCGAGAALGVASARPLVSLLARYASRYSVRALDLTVDAGMLWVATVLAIGAALLLAFVPRLPSADSTPGFGRRVTRNSARRQRIFAITQVAASFVLLAGASVFVKTLLALQTAPTGFDTRHVLAVNVPVMSHGKTPEQIVDFYRETTRRIASLPGVDSVAVGTAVPWRDAGAFGPGFAFSIDGRVRAPGEDESRARFRTVTPGFFASLGIPLIAGRDFTDADRRGAEPVVIVSQSLAQRLLPNQDAVNHRLAWTDALMKFVNVSGAPRRIVGIAADVDDENIAPVPTMTVYHPFAQEQLFGGRRLFVHAHGNPYALVAPLTRIVHQMSADQVVELAATLEDIHAEVLAPDRLNTLVFGGFAALALAIAVLGVAGVLAFSVNGRMQEFGIRLALGSRPRRLLAGVIGEGMALAIAGVLAGAACAFPLSQWSAGYLPGLQSPDALTLAASIVTLLTAAILASAAPAARAARVDVTQALRQ
jgi:putative ABC transport system permease protein